MKRPPFALPQEMEYITEPCMQKQILAHAYWTHGMQHWENCKGSLVPLDKTRRKTLTIIDTLGENSIEFFARRYSRLGYDEAHQMKSFHFWHNLRLHHTGHAGILDGILAGILGKLLENSVFHQPCLRPSKVCTAFLYTSTDHFFKYKYKISIYGCGEKREELIDTMPYRSLELILYPLHGEDATRPM